MSNPVFRIEHGRRFPYDERTTGDWATAAARGVIADLTDRRGIKNGFDSVDQRVREEIVNTLADIIRTCNAEMRT